MPPGSGGVRARPLSRGADLGFPPGVDEKQMKRLLFIYVRAGGPIASRPRGKRVKTQIRREHAAKIERTMQSARAGAFALFVLKVDQRASADPFFASQRKRDRGLTDWPDWPGSQSDDRRRGCYKVSP